MMHFLEKSDSYKTDSIENQRLPSLPVLEERVDRILTSSKDRKYVHKFGNSEITCQMAQNHNQKTTFSKPPFQDMNRHNKQKKAYAIPKFGQHGYKSFRTNQCHSATYDKPLTSQNSIKGFGPRKSYEKLVLSEDSKKVDDADDVITLDFKNGIFLPKLQPHEAKFLELVSQDDVNEVNEYVEEYPEVNVNCINFQGVNAFQIAIENKNLEMVELLLSFSHIEIGDSVLHAVRCNNIKILVTLLNAQNKISPGLEFAGVTHSAAYPSHLTPLILAAQLGHFEIVSFLISRGHVIEYPHSINCYCEGCRTLYMNDDPLYACSARLSAFRAIASPAYLVHVSSDPILSAFRLNAELANNAAACRQLACAYRQLADDVSAFAVDLIGCCRTSEEVEFILKQTSGCTGRRHFVLPRLLMAVDYRQKEFVAHPNTQQVLESYWLGDWHDWRCTTTIKKLVTILTRIFVTPAILIVCMLAPRHHLVRHWQIPLNKLITHIAAYFVFLALVFHISNQNKSCVKRGPPTTGAEAPLILYVVGYTWSALRMIVMQGPHRYFSKMWNWAEVIMLSLFGLTFIFWILAAIDIAVNDHENLERKYWCQYDPTLVAEGTFCLATIFAFFRLMFLCQLNYHLGPLQVSLGKMTIDIYKYIILFTIIISSFASGLACFYQYYDGMVYEDEFGMKTVQVSSFTSLSDTLNTLFWALFCMAPLESADVVLENTRDPRSLDKNHENRHAYTERIGYFCFGCFEVISVIVVLNMLIATMSNTFQRVNDNVDIEWTFGKTEVYIDYMLQTTLPSPFNLIPSASGMGTIVDWCYTRIARPRGIYARWSPFYCCYIERDLEAGIERNFPALMSVLVQRYFRDKDVSQMCANQIESDLVAMRRNHDCIS